MVEVAASIVGLTAFGTGLVTQLYKFGSNVSAAREQTARIGDRIADYMTILDVLEGVIDQDPSFISSKAEDLIDRLCEQSYDLFDEINALLPRGRDKLTLKDKVAWNFRKAKVELMLGQIEYIKSNVLLLVMTTLLGKKIRSRRKKRAKSDGDRQRESVEQQAARANNIVVQHMNAAEKLQALEKELERSDATEPSLSNSSTDVVPYSNTSIELMSRQVNVIAAFQKSMASARDAAAKQSLMIQRSPQLVNDLLMEWTRAYEPNHATTLRNDSAGETPPASTGEQHGDPARTHLDRPMTSHHAAPSNYRSGVDEQKFREDQRSDASIPPSSQAQHFHRWPSRSRPPMPTTTRSSKRDAHPKYPSNIKHTESHFPNTGDSYSTDTLYQRDESPKRKTTRPRYQTVDIGSEDEKFIRDPVSSTKTNDSDNGYGPMQTPDSRKKSPRRTTTRSRYQIIARQ